MDTSKDTDCCKAGTDWAEEPVGTEQRLGPVDAYVSANLHSSREPLLLLIHDFHGWRTRNLRVMADRYAQRGFRVVLPDLFHDERVEPGWSPEQQAAFWERHPLPETVQLAEGVLAACKDLHAGLVGMQGFCWGAKLIVALAEKQKIAAAVFSHASKLTAEDVEGISFPCFFCFSGPTDHQIPPDKREQFAKILGGKDSCGWHYFPEALHGWTLKGDDKDPQVAKDAQEAFDLALAWFQKHVK